jgi:tetratricopeptide (TPR) repeat protein
MLVLALTAALAAAAATPDTAEQRLQAGRAALAAKNYKQARLEFSAVLGTDPANAAAHFSLGIIALIEDDPAEGLRHFSALPGDPRAMIGLLDCELRLRMLEQARRTAAELSTLTANSPAASEHAGRLLAKAGEYQAAVPFLRRSTGAAAANLLGMAEEKSGNLDASVRAFSEAVRIEPSNEDYRIDYAAVLLNSGKAQEAIAVFHTAARDFPGSARVRLGLGSALYLAGRHQAAAEALLEAVRLEPSPRAFDLLGKAYEAAGELQTPIRAEFEKYLADKPSDAAAYAHYGAMLHAAGADPAAVRKQLARALELDPRLASAHMQLGMVAQAAGSWSAALQYYKRAAELEPDNASLRYRLATVYQALGEREKARAEREKFLRLKARGVSERP